MAKPGLIKSWQGKLRRLVAVTAVKHPEPRKERRQRHCDQSLSTVEPQQRPFVLPIRIERSTSLPSKRPHLPYPPPPPSTSLPHPHTVPLPSTKPLFLLTWSAECLTKALTSRRHSQRQRPMGRDQREGRWGTSGERELGGHRRMSRQKGMRVCECGGGWGHAPGPVEK